MATAISKPDPAKAPLPFSNRVVALNSAPLDFDAARDLPEGFLEFLAPLHAALTLRQRALLARRGYRKLPLKRYNYGVRICPEPVHWGGLSGSTYTEAVSWGKFVPPEEGGRFAEVFDDATVALPLIVRAVLERIGYYKHENCK